MNNNEDIEKELYACKGYEVNLRLVSFWNSILIYQANVEQLRIWYKKLNNQTAALFLWNPEVSEIMEMTNIEMQRLFTNFLSSAFSLRDHLYALVNEYYAETSITTELDECKKKYFTDNYLVQFVQDFRNYVVHKGFPNIKKELKIVKKISNDIVFTTDELKRYSGWKAGAKKYLDSVGDGIKLIDIVENYNNVMNEYYKEIMSLFVKYHIDELTELKQIKDKYGLKLHMVSMR